MQQDDPKPKVGRVLDTPSGRRPSLDDVAYTLHRRLSAEGDVTRLGDHIAGLLGYGPFLISRRVSRQELVRRIAFMLTTVAGFLPQPVPNQDEVFKIAESLADDPEAIGTLFDVCEEVMPAAYPLLPE